MFIAQTDGHSSEHNYHFWKLYTNLKINNSNITAAVSLSVNL